jgi:hypothetical protein
MNTVSPHHRQNPFWLETLAFLTIVTLHLSLATDLMSVNALCLAGETTREAWRALMFLSEKHFIHTFNVLFESDLYCFLFVPFLHFFGNSVLTLKLAGLSFSLLTVCVLYVYLRRAYGLTAALCFGSVYAASPLLLAHATLASEFSIPLWIGILLLLETLGPAGNYFIALAAGFFTSLHPYLVFPLFGYIAGRVLVDFRKPPPYHRNVVIPAYIVLFFIGLLPLEYRLFCGQTAPGTLAPWCGHLFTTNASHWDNLLRTVQNLWVQVTWSAGSFRSSQPAHGPALLNAAVVLWAVLLAMALLFRESRRWAVTLAAGLLPAAFITAPTGLGMRHLLAFWPFFWLPAAALTAQLSWRQGKFILCAAAAAVCWQYYAIDMKVLAHNTQGMRIAAGVEGVKNVLAMTPRPQAVIISRDSNLFYDMKYLLPGKEICGREPTDGLREGEALILLPKGDADRGLDPVNGCFIPLGNFPVSDRTTCRILYEK